MLKIILIAAFILTFTVCGTINVYRAVHYRIPPVTTLKATPPHLLPTFVTLKDVTFDIEHLLKLKYGTEVLYIPVRAKGASSTSQYPIMIQTSAAELIAAVGSNSPDALKHLAALAMRTEVTGRVCTVDARELSSFRAELPLVAEDVVLIDEGATPHMIPAVIMLATGIAVGLIAVAGGFKKAAPAQASATQG
jgi:hypothetical protein